MSVYNYAFTSCNPNQRKKIFRRCNHDPRDITIAAVKPSVRLRSEQPQVLFVQWQRGSGCRDFPCHLKHCSDFWKVTRVMFILKIVPRYAYDMHPLSVRRQAINRINDGLMLFEAWSTRFMALNNNTLSFTKENAFEKVVCTIWAFLISTSMC